MSENFKIEYLKKQKQTFLKFKKRTENMDNQVNLPKPSDQLVPGGVKRTADGGFRFDLSGDPIIVEARNRIFEKMKLQKTTGGGLGSLPEFEFSASSSGEFTTRDGFKTHAVKKAKADSLTTEFKTASGRSVVREVLPITADDDSLEKKTVEKDRYLGNRLIKAPGRQFRAPKISNKEEENDCLLQRRSTEETTDAPVGNPAKREGLKANPSLKHFDQNIIELIESEIMSKKQETKWSDVAGLDAAKKALNEIIVFPFLRPDIFKGIRAPPKGVLLFGPPGTGKTMIGRCVASQCKATFFNIAASSLTSKWVGEGEKLVRVLFTVARVLQPSVIFIDEIDSLLTSRSEGEHESSRRIKTEFLIHLDGVATTSEERILVLGATNRPYELDDAAKRRFAKRLYIPLPCSSARMQIIRSLLNDQANDLTEEDVKKVADLTEGYSGADMRQLCAEASMCPVREIIDSSSLEITTVGLEQVRAVSLKDFEASVLVVRPTVLVKDLDAYEEWDKQFGSICHTVS